MKIEEGKFYRTRDGQKVGPIRRNGPATLFMWTDGYHTWLRDGQHAKRTEPSALDLVAEWTDESPAPDYNDGKWHGWNGRGCPVHLKAVIDYVWHDLRSGKVGLTTEREAGDSVAWGQVIRFRVVTPYREPAVAWRDSGGAFWPTREEAALFCEPGDEPVRFVEARE